jgi:hypothetical protein
MTHRKKLGLAVIGGLVLLVGIGSILAMIAHRPAPAKGVQASVSIVASAPASDSPSTVVSASPTASASVHIHIDTNPPGARLTLDGEPVSNPFDRDIAPDSSAHAVTAAWGTTRTTPMPLRFSERANITIEIPKSVPLGAPRPLASGAPSATKAASNPHCENPFYVDSSGIRRVRPQCL